MTDKTADRRLPCATCRREFDPALLDAKPTPRDLARHKSLEACADAGCDFSRLECEECYGPGFNAL